VKYNPKDADQNYPAGEYEAVLVKVEATESKAGNPMEVIHFEVYGPDGDTMKLRDYFVEGNKVATRRYRALAEALDALTKFNVGSFNASDYLQSRLILRLEIDGEFNKVAGFIKLPVAGSAPRRTPGGVQHVPVGDDDIPF
jgi:hypothetical protein